MCVNVCELLLSLLLGIYAELELLICVYFLRNCHTIFLCIPTILHPTGKAQGFYFSSIITNTCQFLLFYNSHPNEYEMSYLGLKAISCLRDLGTMLFVRHFGFSWVGEQGAVYRMGDMAIQPAFFSDILEARLSLRKKGEGIRHSLSYPLKFLLIQTNPRHRALAQLYEQDWTEPV